MSNGGTRRAMSLVTEGQEVGDEHEAPSSATEPADHSPVDDVDDPADLGAVDVGGPHEAGC